jgi:hypothetical protein
VHEPLDLPVVVDKDRMRGRPFRAMHGDALDQAVRDLCPWAPYDEAVAADFLRRLRSLPDVRKRYELEHVVFSCPDPKLLAPQTRQMLRDLLEAIRTSVIRLGIHQRVKQWGAARTRELIAHKVSAAMRLRSTTWDPVEAADVDELAFLYATMCAYTSEWYNHHAI